MSTEPFTIERYESRAEWLTARKRGIGASEAACVLGFGRFKSAYSIATDKLTEGFDEDVDESAEWGTRLEPAIAQKCHEIIKRPVHDTGQFTIFRSKERPHIFCTPDRLVPPDGVLEIKTAHFEAAAEWKERVPLPYQIQLMQTLYVTGFEQGWFACLVDGYRFRMHPMRRNEYFISRMLPKLDAFWADIQRGKMPNVDGSMATARALARLYPKPGDGLVELPPELESLGAEYDELLAQGREAEKRKDEIANIVKEHIGHKKTAVLMDRSGFSWNGNGKGSRTFRRVARIGDLPDE